MTRYGTSDYTAGADAFKLLEVIAAGDDAPSTWELLRAIDPEWLELANLLSEQARGTR